ncbi:MAG: hypothetical protein EBU97_05915, partial [Rhodobacteraceae bacterium]|nr:hypothetical protein [Paracoccaceae bacterium]
FEVLSKAAIICSAFLVVLPAHALHDQTADEWSTDLHGRALLVLGPDRKTPPLLIVRNAQELRGILLNLMMVTGHQNGPRATISVLTDGGAWVSWQDRSQMPMLLEKLTWKNISEITGAYASWQPRLFLAVLGVLCLIFAAFFSTYVVFSRRVR